MVAEPLMCAAEFSVQTLECPVVEGTFATGLVQILEKLLNPGNGGDEFFPGYSGHYVAVSVLNVLTHPFCLESGRLLALR
jgi:hypothetical protein